MSDALVGQATAPAIALRQGSGVGRSYRVELRKLTTQLPLRLVALVCLVGPFVFAAGLQVQSGVPADTLFGRWVHITGFATPLVVLGFAGTWGFPVLTGILAGDIFSSEDRHGTWKTVLTRSCRRRDIFVGKVLAAATCSTVMVLILALSSLLAGATILGDQPLVGLSGQLLSAGHSTWLVLASWLINLLPVLAFTSVAVLFSVASRNGIVGVLGPAVVGLVMQLLLLVGTGPLVRTVLVGSAFDAWHGLFAAHPYYRPLAQGAAVSVGWTVACLEAAWLLLRRRDFAGTSGGGGQGRLIRPVQAVAVAAAVLILLVIASSWGPTTITASRVQAAIGPTFSNLTLFQQRLLGRHVPAHASLNVQPNCSRRGGVASRGPGDDWACSLQVFAPQAGVVPERQVTTVTYDVSVKPNGCYTAEGPPSFVGQQMIRDSHKHNVVNPLFEFYGCFDVP